MKIFLYLEFYKTFGDNLYKELGTGICSSYKNQIKMLEKLDIPYSTTWDDSCDIVEINDIWFKSAFYINKAKRQDKRVILWSHRTIEDTQQVFNLVPFVIPFFKKYLINHYHKADLIFAPTEYTRSLLINYGIDPAKIIVHSNGIDINKYHTDPKKRTSGRKKYHLNGLTIGTTGLAIPRKGIDTFLTLAKKFSTYDFVWFGKVPSALTSFWMKPLPKNLPKNIRFTGYVDDILEAYNSLDIFLFPSREENEGISILEAMASGLPILVRDIPVYRGWLEHGKNCLKANTDEEFERLLNELIENKALREKLGQNARLAAKEKSLEAVARQTLSEYKKLLK